MDGIQAYDVRKIALLAGGNSAEREISLASGEQAALSLALEGFEVVQIDPAEMDLERVDWPSFDVCFLALHGGEGENGCVQAQLERFGVPYTGSGPAASRQAMSKSAAKERFLARGVPTPAFVSFSSAESPTEIAFRLKPFGYPLIMKPDSQGSSLGVSVAHSRSDVAACLERMSALDGLAMAETCVEGREFTVSLLGRDPLPMIEIVSPQPIFSYEAKYASVATEYRFDPGLPAGVEARIYESAIQAAAALGTAGLVRVDVMLDRCYRPWVLEVNTIPGLTTRSLAPRAARAAGIDLPALVRWMIGDAMEQSQRRRAAAPADSSQMPVDMEPAAAAPSASSWTGMSSMIVDKALQPTLPYAA